ncbi:uncharacterized protein LOC114366462 [Ostrinia furnacalis]|uniref:uncharacterized protein LOC114366462 n=1 Tax=Ostrinia furnacalis TaxID=93504 RepID=UPI00103D91DD|nr:uncharacterized protein LOC114366462 [Ostrinia furnacalis]
MKLIIVLSLVALRAAAPAGGPRDESIKSPGINSLNNFYILSEITKQNSRLSLQNPVEYTGEFYLDGSDGYTYLVTYTLTDLSKDNRTDYTAEQGPGSAPGGLLASLVGG